MAYRVCLALLMWLASSAPILAKERSHLTCIGSPFSGYVENNQITAVRPIPLRPGATFYYDFDDAPVDSFVAQLPKVFRPGTPMRGINVSGETLDLTVKTVDTSQLRESMTRPAVVFSAKTDAVMAWTGDLRVRLVKQEPVPIPAAVAERLQKDFYSKLMGMAQHIQDEEIKEALVRPELVTSGKMRAFLLNGKAEPLYIRWDVTLPPMSDLTFFYIYSPAQDRMRFSGFKTFSAYDEPSGESWRPIFAFALDDSKRTYFLMHYFDGYEDYVCKIIDAESGAELLKSF